MANEPYAEPPPPVGGLVALGAAAVAGAFGVRWVWRRITGTAAATPPPAPPTNADLPPVPSTPAAPAAGQLGDAHRSLAAGTVVVLPDSFRLRATPRAALLGSEPTLPAGTRVTIRALAPALVRGANETGYQIALVGDARTGYAFVPYNATRG